MKVTFLTKYGQAYINAESIEKEFPKSIRFNMGVGNGKITIKKTDILSIEEDPESTSKPEVNQYNLDRFIEKVEDRAWKKIEIRHNLGKEPFPRDSLYPAKPLRQYITFMNPSVDWLRSLLKTDPMEVALTLLNNSDDMDAIIKITKLFD